MRRLGEEAAAARLQYPPHASHEEDWQSDDSDTIRASARDVLLSPQLLDHVGHLIGLVRRRTRPHHLPDL